ncbi:hypothetical protein CASFOL_039259 [Castilleja foliolosa]|uniref:Pentatricopeptide repeat-containing protein n=1 Tax=Castilleja foliolosa TaxID=1961234 RepID=A0ABD3BHI4_9LAMI
MPISASIHRFSKITASHTCSRSHHFHRHLFARMGATPYSSSSSNTHSPSEIIGQSADRDDDFGCITETNSEKSRVLSSDHSLYSWGGVKCNPDDFNEFDKSEEDEDNDDDFIAVNSIRVNKERTVFRSKIKADEEEDESKHPLVNEICRLVNLRSKWTPNHELELKRILRSLKPSQICAALRALPDERVALKFFYWADRQWRYKHDPIVYHAMLKVLSKTKLCQGAKRVLYLMVRRRIGLWPEDFGFVMVSFSRAGHLRKSLQVLTLMQRFGVDLDISICNTAINVLVEGERLEKALRFCERMKVVGIEPNVITYNCLIKGYCEMNQMGDALKLIDEMPLRGCSPDKVSYYTVMGFLCKEKRVEELRGLLDKTSKSKLVPDQVTYNTLVHMLSKHGNGDDALGFLREAEENGFCIDKVGHTAIVNCYCQEGRLDKAKDIVDEMLLKGCEPDVVTYTSVLNGFCRAGEIDRAKKMLNQMYKHGCKPNCVSYTVILNGLCREGKSLEAREMMSASEGWWSPNAITYGVIMHGLRREGKLSEARDVIREMIRHGFYPNPVEINLLIQSFCRAGETGQARKLMEECLKSGCAVNVVNFTTVIHGFCKTGDLDSALSVFDDMYLNDKHPDEVTYTAVIDALGKKGRINEAIEMTKKMIHSGTNPTQVTYRSLIHNFCKHGKVNDLCKLIEKLVLRENCKTVYNQVIEKLCYFGYVDEAYGLLGKVLRTGSRIDANSCHIVMRSFLKNENPIGSYRVACRMFNRNLVPELKVCEEVSKKLVLIRKFDEADKLMLRFVERGHIEPKVKKRTFE